MRTSKTARYALHAALEMALAGDQPVTVAGVAAQLGLPQTALAKVFQQLVRSGLAVGTRGIASILGPLTITTAGCCRRRRPSASGLLCRRPSHRILVARVGPVLAPARRRLFPPLHTGDHFLIRAGLARRLVGWR